MIYDRRIEVWVKLLAVAAQLNVKSPDVYALSLFN